MAGRWSRSGNTAGWRRADARIDLPEARTWLETLGTALDWHGALSADVIVTDAGPLFIDINPRLVEPENAWRAGVDLVGSMLDVARNSAPFHQPDSKNGIATHQLLLAILGAAQHENRRRAVADQLLGAIRKSGLYAGSVEELTPARRDPIALIPVATAAIVTLAKPTGWTWFASGSVDNYALTPDGWEHILAHVDSL